MARMRTIEQAAAHIKVHDPDTAFTKTALRRLITSGQLKHVCVGNKYLVSLDILEDFLTGTAPAQIPEYSNIRRIG